MTQSQRSFCLSLSNEWTLWHYLSSYLSGRRAKKKGFIEGKEETILAIRQFTCVHGPISLHLYMSTFHPSFELELLLPLTVPNPGCTLTSPRETFRGQCLGSGPHHTKDMSEQPACVSWRWCSLLTYKSQTKQTQQNKTQWQQQKLKADVFSNMVSIAPQQIILWVLRVLVSLISWDGFNIWHVVFLYFLLEEDKHI